MGSPYWYKKYSWFPRLKRHVRYVGIDELEQYIGEKYLSDPEPQHIGDGISFVPKNYSSLLEKILHSRKLAEDDRKTFIGSCAALATKGRGFRSVNQLYEMGKPSVHIAIKSNRVNIHLDEIPFVYIHQGHTFYSPDFISHIGRELAMEWVRKKIGFRHLNIILPDSSNRYSTKTTGLSFEWNFNLRKTPIGIQGIANYGTLAALARPLVNNTAGRLGKNLRINKPISIHRFVGIQISGRF